MVVVDGWWKATGSDLVLVGKKRPHTCPGDYREGVPAYRLPACLPRSLQAGGATADRRKHAHTFIPARHCGCLPGVTILVVGETGHTYHLPGKEACPTLPDRSHLGPAPCLQCLPTGIGIPVEEGRH